MCDVSIISTSLSATDIKTFSYLANSCNGPKKAASVISNSKKEPLSISKIALAFHTFCLNPSVLYLKACSSKKTSLIPIYICSRVHGSLLNMFLKSIKFHRGHTTLQHEDRFSTRYQRCCTTTINLDAQTNMD